MSKPKILIYGNVYDTTVGQGIAYMEFFSQFGDVIIVTSEMNLEWLIEQGDILALPGGMDVLNNKIKPGFYAGKAHPHYEYLDTNLLEPWLLTNKPIIGICRGMQVLNTKLGGTLYRHLNGHQQALKLERYDRPDEMYTIFENDPNFHIYMTNSFHHQGIAIMAEGFELLGWSALYHGCPSLRDVKHERPRWEKEYKNGPYTKKIDSCPVIPEMIRHTSKPYIAFQYHPEEFQCELATKLINEMLENYQQQ